MPPRSPSRTCSISRQAPLFLGTDEWYKKFLLRSLKVYLPQATSYAKGHQTRMGPGIHPKATKSSEHKAECIIMLRRTSKSPTTTITTSASPRTSPSARARYCCSYERAPSPPQSPVLFTSLPSHTLLFTFNIASPTRITTPQHHHGPHWRITPPSCWAGIVRSRSNLQPHYTTTKDNHSQRPQAKHLASSYATASCVIVLLPSSLEPLVLILVLVLVQRGSSVNVPAHPPPLLAVHPLSRSNQGRYRPLALLPCPLNPITPMLSPAVISPHKGISAITPPTEGINRCMEWLKRGTSPVRSLLRIATSAKHRVCWVWLSEHDTDRETFLQAKSISIAFLPLPFFRSLLLVEKSNFIGRADDPKPVPDLHSC